MTTVWKKKVSWFKKKPEPRTYDYDWEYTYLNAIGNPVKCIIIQRHGKGYVDVLNENGVTVFGLETSRLSEYNDVDKKDTE
jgi:hypothetical protein